MTISNTTSLAGIAKEIYPVDDIKAMEQVDTEFLSTIEEGKGLEFSATDGGRFTFAVKAYGPHGQKMLNELEALPTARASNVQQGTSYVKEYAGVLQFSKRELELAKGDVRSFANAKTFEMENLILNAHKYRNRQVANGDGTGLITLTEAVVASTTINVDDATPFQIGMVIDVFDGVTSLKVGDALVVEDIDILSAQHSIVVDVAITAAADSEVYISGVNDNASTDGKEMIGLPLVTDDGTLATSFQGIARTGAGEVPNYRGITIDASSGPISVALINQACTRAKRISGFDIVKSNDICHLVSPEQWRGYASLVVPQLRFMPSDSPDMNKPFTQYECQGKKVILDTDVDRNSWYIYKKSCIKMATAAPLDWESDLGGTSLKWLSGYAQGVMVLYGLFQMFSEAPRDAVRIQSLSDVAI